MGGREGAVRGGGLLLTVLRFRDVESHRQRNERINTLQSNTIDRTPRLDVDAVLAPFIFPKALNRLREYLTAREQYDLTSAMARNQVRGKGNDLCKRFWSVSWIPPA